MFRRRGYLFNTPIHVSRALVLSFIMAALVYLIATIVVAKLSPEMPSERRVACASLRNRNGTGMLSSISQRAEAIHFTRY